MEIEGSGNAERVLRDKCHFNDKAKSLLKHGIVPSEDGWGGWLGHYQSAIMKAANDLDAPRVRFEHGRDR